MLNILFHIFMGFALVILVFQGGYMARARRVSMPEETLIEIGNQISGIILMIGGLIGLILLFKL